MLKNPVSAKNQGFFIRSAQLNSMQTKADTTTLNQAPGVSKAKLSFPVNISYYNLWMGDSYGL